MRKKSALVGLMAALILSGVLQVYQESRASSLVDGPQIVFNDSSPANDAWINYNNPLIRVDSDQALSEAKIAFELLNGGLENGDTAYFSSDGYYWEIDASTRKSGSYSARSSSYFNGAGYYDYSSFTRTVILDSDSGVSFWWKVSTAEPTDTFSFYVNGALKDEISGAQDWTERSYDLPAGNYDLVWKYKKSQAGVEGRDYAWLDEVKIFPYAMEIASDGLSADYQARAIGEGLHKYSVIAKDQFDSEAVSELRSLKVDTLAPSGYITVSPYYQNHEVNGNLGISVSLQDDNSYVREVCLWLGDEAENLLPLEYDECRVLSQKSIYSWPYAPDFSFGALDSSLIKDGEYNLYAIVNDNANNEKRLLLPIRINNQGEGSATNPSQIRDCADLQAINNHLHWHYQLANDIDCSESREWNNGEGFRGIGNGGQGFDGKIDGKNFHVYHLYQNLLTENSGIFDYLGGTVENINFRKAEIICNSTYCGGFAGFTWGEIKKSSITGRLQCSGQCGSFASQHSGIISESWADMTIGSGGYASGIAGQTYGGIIRDSYFKGSIIADNGGGLVGLSQGSLINSYSSAKINDSVYNGALIGWQYAGNQNASYWDKEVAGLANMCGTDGLNCLNENGLSTVAMKDAASYAGWDFENIWAIDPTKNDGYPYLRWQTTFSEKDISAPVITLVGQSKVSLYLGESYHDAGAIAVDDQDGNISTLIVTNNPVDTSVLGTYLVTYNVADEAGNQAKEVIRTVKIITKPQPSSSGGGGGSLLINKKPEPGVPQVFDPVTGILNVGVEIEAQPIETDEEVVVLGIEAEFPNKSEAELVKDSVQNKASLLSHLSGQEEKGEETRVQSVYERVLAATEGFSIEESGALINFITYGTKSTLRLGQGERAGVLSSYQSAFAKLPRTLAEWEDAIKIANGRWPNERSSLAEAEAEKEFERIYRRPADRNDKHDDAALVVVAYGLRPADRKLESEKAAIRIFRDIYGTDPIRAQDWDIVRAIAYSGATR